MESAAAVKKHPGSVDRIAQDLGVAEQGSTEPGFGVAEPSGVTEHPGFAEPSLTQEPPPPEPSTPGQDLDVR